MATLGIISYGIYLWHIIWVHQLKGWVHDGTIGTNIWIWFLIVISLTLATATLSYLWVERPAIRWSHRQWPSGRRPSPSPAAPATAEPVVAESPKGEGS